jgi:hypothetical protein
VTWAQLTEWLGESVGPIYLMGATQNILGQGVIDASTTEADPNAMDEPLGANDPEEQ